MMGYSILKTIFGTPVGIFIYLAIGGIYINILTYNCEKILKGKYPDLYAWGHQPSWKKDKSDEYFGQDVRGIHPDRGLRLFFFPPKEFKQNEIYASSSLIHYLQRQRLFWQSIY